ncbi:hypothetical protein [Alteribacillus sp. HJP-4]|uniref:hypothetical protein n=1 Tax=Alteribacillus sp. HJP-4 TaxID=2775394 RepID=UPI0035CCD95F
MRKKIYLHLGYHKTATTFLQQSIYPKLKNVNFVRYGLIKRDYRRIRLNTLTDMDIENIRNFLISFNNGQPMLFSYEGLSGSPFSPKPAKTQLEILTDLRRIFPKENYDVHVIIGLREQVELFTSLYVQHLHQGGILDGKGFIKYCEHNGSIHNFHFNNYLKNIEELFGEDRLFLMVYEYFRENRDQEMLRLLNYMGEPEIPKYKNQEWNKSYGTMQVAVARKLNRYFKTPIHPKGKLPIIEIPKVGNLSPRNLLQNKLSFKLHYKRYEFPDSLQNELKERYSGGNKIVDEKYKLNLPQKYFY